MKGSNISGPGSKRNTYNFYMYILHRKYKVRFNDKTHIQLIPYMLVCGDTVAKIRSRTLSKSGFTIIIHSGHYGGSLFTVVIKEGLNSK